MRSLSPRRLRECLSLSATGEIAGRASAATRLGAQLTVSLQEAVPQFSRIAHEFFKDRGAARPPFGHLVGRGFVDLHAVLLRKSVSLAFAQVQIDKDRLLRLHRRFAKNPLVLR